MTAAFLRRLSLTNFRSYHAAQVELARAGTGGADRRQRRRQDQSDRGHLAAGARPRPAPRHHGGTGVLRRRRRLGGVGRDRGHAGAGHARHRHRAAGGRRRRARAAMPHRPRERSARPPPSPIICAWSGSRRPWTGCSTGRLPSAGAFSTAWCWRWMRRIPAASPRSSVPCARATGCWRTPPATRIGSTRSSTRPPSSRWRWRRRAPRRWRGCRRRSRPRATAAPEFPLAEVALDGWMEQLLPAAQRDRDRGPLPRAAEGQPRARRRRRPHARRPASVRPEGDACRQGRAGGGCLHRRAEGAAHSPGARACRADQGDDRLRAGAAARRGDRASRPRPARRALRRARRPRRAGMDDRRRPGGLRRHRRSRALCSRCATER